MKTINFKVLIGSLLVLLMCLTLKTFGQTTTPKVTKKADKKVVKIEKSKIPIVVTETYIKEYPKTLHETWYGYPAFVDEYDWYGYDPYLYSSEYPEYYVVEFTEGTTPQKVIYSKSGKKIATHKNLAAIPAAILTAISVGEYKTWKIGKSKEEIFKDADADELKIYKVEVEKGKERHFLFYQASGNLVRDRKLN
jgi:hypothetical protein